MCFQKEQTWTVQHGQHYIPPAIAPFSPFNINLDPRALLRMTRREIESSGEPWSKIASDWFQQKNNKKGVSDWSIQVRARAVESAACLACEWLFP